MYDDTQLVLDEILPDAFAVMKETAKRFVHIMENVLELEVPLECSVSVGDSWGELK